MDFTRIPKDILVKIFEHLDIKEKVRCGRVCRRFQEASHAHLSRLTELDLADGSLPLYSRVTDGLAKIIELCSRRLEKVIYSIPYDLDKMPRPNERVIMFSAFTCPRLTELDIGGSKTQPETVRDLIANHPNLRTFKSSLPTIFDFPNIRCEKMETVILNMAQPEFIQSISRQCPNLKHLAILYWNGRVREPMQPVFNQILGNLPNLTHFELRIDTMSLHRYKYADLNNFWALTSLTSLSLRCHAITDQVLGLICKNFKQLEKFEVGSPDRSATDHGIGQLAVLPNLKELKFNQNPPQGVIRQGICRLAERGRLRKLDLGDAIVPTVALTFIQKCHCLQLFHTRRFEGVDSEETASQFLRTLADFPQQQLMIQVDAIMHEWHFWETAQVRNVLNDINSRAGGRKLKISIPGAAISLY